MCKEGEHNWTYQGIVYDHSKYNMPGSGARERMYYERYFCSKCLEKKDDLKGVEGNSYYAVAYNATPR